MHAETFSFGRHGKSRTPGVISVPAGMCNDGNDSDDSQCDLSDDEPKQTTGMLRSQTWSSHTGGMRRSEVATLRPAAVAQLHKLHEAFLSAGPTCTVEDTRHQTLDGDWGRSSSWQVYGDCPADREKPLRARGFRAVGKRRGDAQSMLHGAGFAAINTKGQKSLTDASPGQDNFSVSHLPSGWEVLCVMDGHGHAGHWPATRAVRTVPFFLAGSSCSTMLRHGEVEAALTHAFDKAQADLKFRSLCERVDLQASGCTAVCVLWRESSRHVWVATCGDSRAVLFAPGRGVLAQTEDHKPSVPAENDRIYRCGGEVVCTRFDDGYVEWRVNLIGEDYPGISMTRSLGDLVVKNAGVIAEPQIVKWERAPGSMVIAATDGVWEFLSTETVVKMVLDCLEKGGSYDQALADIVQASRAAWKQHEGEYCDDITIVLASPEGTRSVRSSALRCFQGVCKSSPTGCMVS